MIFPLEMLREENCCFGNKPLYDHASYVPWQQKGRMQLSVRIPKKESRNHKLPVIKCSFCGAEIILLPNVKLMSEAIEAHVQKHIQKIKDAPKAEAEAEHLRDNLITQVLDKASKQMHIDR